MYFGYLNLQNIRCIAYCVTSKTTKFLIGVDKWKSHFWYLLCHHVFTITRLNWHGIDLKFSVKDFVSQYTHYVSYVGHKRHHSNVTHIWSKQTAFETLSSARTAWPSDSHVSVCFKLLQYYRIWLTWTHVWQNIIKLIIIWCADAKFGIH